MKYAILFLLSVVCVWPAESRTAFAGNPYLHNFPVTNNIIPDGMIILQGGAGSIGIPAVEFKAQKFCRAEPVEDFEFDVHFSVVSADVYFSGANFISPVKGAINSSSLEPIRKFMDQSKPGTIVTFDNIKVKGPDNAIRTIDGVTYLLK